MIPNISVTAAGASRSLVQQATVTGELGAGADTAKVDRLIIVASQAIARLLGREPWLQTYSIKLQGPGGHYLKLPRWPIKSNPVVTEGTGSSPTTIDATTYTVAGNTRRDRLYRVNGWTLTREDQWRAFTSADGPDLVYTVTPDAGWVMPDQLTAYPTSGATAVSLNAWYKATDDDEPFIFQVTTAGTTNDGTEPTWPTAHEGTVTDGTAVFTAYDLRLPQELEEAALMMVLDLYAGGWNRPSGIKREAFEGAMLEYMTAADGGSAVNQAVRAIVAGYR